MKFLLILVKILLERKLIYYMQTMHHEGGNLNIFETAKIKQRSSVPLNI